MKLGYSSDNRQDCTHCRFYLKDTPFQNDTAKLQLFHKPAKGWRKFYYNELSLVVCFTRIAVNVPRIVINCLGDIASGCRWLQQPCHACMGRCGCGHLFPSFCLETKGPKISRPTSWAYRTRQPPLPHVGQARAPNPVGLRRFHNSIRT